MSTKKKFLSTLSLRRATDRQRERHPHALDFYPRSPCGERPCDGYYIQRSDRISIHALLAESDKRLKIAQWAAGKFLSTLSLRRATKILLLTERAVDGFLSTLSLRRATTGMISTSSTTTSRFLSTLSLRRATRIDPDQVPGYTISIHALLAESDL